MLPPPPRMTSKSGRGCVCVRCVLHVGVIAGTEGGRASEGGRANKKRNGMGRSFEIGGGGGSGLSERDRREDGDCDCMRERKTDGGRATDVHARMETADSGRWRFKRQKSDGEREEERDWAERDRKTRGQTDGTELHYVLRTTTTRNVAPVSLRLGLTSL